MFSERELYSALKEYDENRFKKLDRAVVAISRQQRRLIDSYFQYGRPQRFDYQYFPQYIRNERWREEIVEELNRIRSKWYQNPVNPRICEVCFKNHPTYHCCSQCNYDTHRCHFCGEDLGHAGIGHCYPED